MLSRVAHRLVVHDLDGDTKPEITFAISDHESCDLAARALSLITLILEI